jgi:hypothetical protein
MSSTTIRTVTGELSYLDPASTVLRRFTAPGASVNTGNYLPYEMAIHDGRPVSSQFSLDRNGFASRVATLGWTLRRSAAPGENASQPQAALVHDDFSVSGGRGRAAAAYADRFPDGPGYHRALITSLWRVFSPPPQDWPLAICDYTSVGPDEGLDNRLYFVDEIPADLYAEMPADWPGTSGFEFHHKPGHQWWYFPDMNRDEILFFTLNDSDQSRAWRVPHSAFHDAAARATVPRHSIEFRSIAYFE